MSLILKNGRVFIDGKLKKVDIFCDEKEIKYVGENCDINCKNVIECKDLYVFPGFIDCHIHGGGGGDSCNQTTESYTKIVTNQVKYGTTSIVLTIGGMSDDFIHDSIELTKQINNLAIGANILGVHLEGPWINSEKRAAIPNNYLDETGSLYRGHSLVDGYENYIKIVTLSPEIQNINEIIKFLRERNISVSIGHTVANYETTVKAIRDGANGFTHLYNVNTPIVAREPGVVGAALTSDDCYCEIITDGYHVHPANIKILLNSKKEKMILVTDAIEVTGTAAKTFSLPGLENIEVHDGRTWGPKNSLIGSILTQQQALKNMVNWKMTDLDAIIKMLTENPAKYIGVYPKKGCIKKGSDADLTIMDSNFNVVYTIVNGQILYKG